jgi:hypothetical protein
MGYCEYKCPSKFWTVISVIILVVMVIVSGYMWYEYKKEPGLYTASLYIVTSISKFAAIPVVAMACVQQVYSQFMHNNSKVPRFTSVSKLSSGY